MLEIKLKKLPTYFLFIVFVTVYSCDILFATSLGSHLEVVEEREFVVDLYLVGLKLSDNLKIKGAHFAWLPAQVKEECLNKSHDECRTYYHEHYRVDKNVEGGIAGLRRNSFLKKIFNEHPDRVLDEWLTSDMRYNNERLLLDRLANLKFIAGLLKNGNKDWSFPIMKDKKIKARIHWELWPNGQNFKVIKFLE